MLKNLDDYLSLLVLLFITIYSLRLLIYAYMKSKKLNHDIDHELSKWQLFKDYNDNIED